MVPHSSARAAQQDASRRRRRRRCCSSGSSRCNRRSVVGVLVMVVMSLWCWWWVLGAGRGDGEEVFDMDAYHALQRWRKQQGIPGVVRTEKGLLVKRSFFGAWDRRRVGDHAGASGSGNGSGGGSGNAGGSVGDGAVAVGPLSAEELDRLFQTAVEFDPRLPVPVRERGKVERKVLTYRWKPCLQFACQPSYSAGTGAVVGRCSPESALALPTFSAARNGSRSSLPTTVDGDPPCCMSLLRDVLLEFGDLLTESGVPYFAHYGTLLGILRGDGIIPWTADVDIALREADWQRVRGDRRILRKMFDRGFLAFSEGDMGRVCFGPLFANGALRQWPPSPGYHDELDYLSSFPYMDVYTYGAGFGKKQRLITTQYGPCVFERENIEPFGKTALSADIEHRECVQDMSGLLRGDASLSSRGKSVRVRKLNACVPLPAQPLKIVESLYGKKAWRQPPPVKNLHGGPKGKYCNKGFRG